MKKLLSVILAVVMVTTMFVGISVQPVSAEDTATETAETTEAVYRYESIFDFSQDIPETTTLNENKAYTVDRVKDGETWAMKITQASSSYVGDYTKFKLSDPITIPSSEDVAFNEELIGMRMVYRLGNSAGGNIGFVINGAWTFNFLDPNNYNSSDKVFFDAGTYDKTLKFADYSNVALGSSYELVFEPRSSAAGTPFEIYIYDIQFVYEVTEYRYSTVYDFENMTTEKVQSLFQKEGSGANPVFSIVEDTNGKKALQVVAESAVTDGSYNGVRFETTSTTAISGQGFELPTDDNLVGIRIHYEGINLRKAGIQLYDGSKSIDIDTQTYSTDIGEKEVVYIFSDSTNWADFSRGSARFWFRMQGGTAGDATKLPGIKIYEIEFIYSNVYEGTAVTVEDFENMSDSDAQSYMKQGGDNDSSTGASYTYSIVENYGYNGSKGLKLELGSKSGYFTHKGSNLNFDDESIIGIRICYRVPKKISSLSIQLHQYNVGNLYSIASGTVQRGMYDKVIMLDDITTLNRSSNYPTYIQVTIGDSNTSIIFDEIQYIYKEGTASGEEDIPKYRYSTVYDFENMTDAQAQSLFKKYNNSWADADISIQEDTVKNDKYLKIMANTAYSDYGRNATSWQTTDFNIPNDEHCVGIRIHYEGINLRAGRIAFLQSYDWTDINMLTESSTDIGEIDAVAFFKDDTKLTISSSSSVALVLQLKTVSTSDTTLLPGIKIYKIEFLYDDVYDGSTVTVRDYEDKEESPACECNAGTITNDSEDITHNGGTSGTTEFAYISGAGQNVSMGLKRTTDSGVSWHNDSFLKISKETMADPALIGMRLWVSLNNRGTPRIQVRYNGSWTTLQFNASDNELNVGAHDIVVMFKDGLIEVGTDSTTTDFSTARYSASTDFYLALDEGGANEIVFDNIEFIYANPTTAEFIDATGISGTNNVHTTEGRVGAEIEFPANLASVNEYEYFFAGWAQETGKDNIIASGSTHSDTDAKYYAVWTPGVSELRKVVLGNTTSAWVESNVNEDDVVDIRDLVYQNEYTGDLKFQAALAEMNMSGTAFLKSFGTQEAATVNGFAATANTEVATSKDLEVGDYIQLNFADYTSINTFTVNETTTNVRDFRIMAWNGEEWVRVYRNDLIEGTHECVLEQDVCTLALRLYIDELKDGATTAKIASVTANGIEKFGRTEKFGLTAFIGDSVYKHNWETIDSDILEAYDDVIMINNWHFDEAGNLAVSVSTDEGSTRTLYSSTSDDAKTWTKTFLDNYDGLFDGDVKNEDKPKIWLSLTALKKEGNWDSTLNNFSPMNQAWYEGITGTYQPGESNAYGEKTVRTALITNITNYISYIETTLGYEIYGIDIDWEYPYGDEQQEDYYNLIKELGTALHADGKKLSIDQLVDWCNLPYSYYNDPAIDRINIMTYSQEDTGTDNQHSTYLDACVNVIEMYADAGVDLSKIYLGVPFYGVETVEKNAGSTDWNKISTDAFDRGVNNYTIGDVEYNFNGPNLLQDKVLYSLQQELGGMMVWWIKNDYTIREATEAGIEYNKDLTLTYYLRDAVERFSYVDDQE